jgi:hypothetical protein
MGVGRHRIRPSALASKTSEATLSLDAAEARSPVGEPSGGTPSRTRIAKIES